MPDDGCDDCIDEGTVGCSMNSKGKETPSSFAS